MTSIKMLFKHRAGTSKTKGVALETVVACHRMRIRELEDGDDDYNSERGDRIFIPRNDIPALVAELAKLGPPGYYLDVEEFLLKKSRGYNSCWFCGKEH